MQGWIEGFQASISYIEENLTEPLDITEIAGIAGLSPFYYQRIFGALCGITVGDYIRARRMTLAAQELAGTDAKVIDLNLILYGLGRSNLFSEISFSELVDKIIAKHEPNKSYIVVTPKLNANGMNALKKLRDFSYYESCIVYADGKIEKGGKK